MEAKLYDSVAVKDCEMPQKAYACSNPMEFFAELSVAYMWGNTYHRLKDDDDPMCAYNKWYRC